MSPEVKAILAALEQKELQRLEDGAKEVIDSLMLILSQLAKESKNPYDDVAVVALSEPFKKALYALADKIKK